MKISKKIILLLVAGTFFSCSNSGPVAYKSISGSWRCQEFRSIGGSRSYIVELDRTKNDTTQYLMSNFYNLEFDDNVLAHLKGTKVSISQQQIGSSTSIVENGSGVVSLNFTRIDFTYDIYDGLNDIKVNAIYTR